MEIDGHFAIHEAYVMNRLSIISLLILLGGCVSQEGVTIVPSAKGAEHIIIQREQAIETGDRDPADVPTNIILVGTVSAFRAFDDADEANKFYEDYVDFAEELHPGGAPEYTAEEFREAIAGWTKVKFFTVPLVVGLYDYALVPVAIREDIRFPSGFGTFMVQEAGDMLAARTNDDGYFVVRELLCKDGEGYAECAENYEKGIFDGVTGEELHSTKLVPKPDGDRIDPDTYLKIQEAVEATN